MATLCLLLGDQLNTQISSLVGFNKATDRILMAEVKTEATYVKHHKKKIAFLFSAMRHFAIELEEQGYSVTYIKYDASDNKGSLLSELEHMLKAGNFNNVKVCKPAEYRLHNEISNWSKYLNIDLEITPDNRFIASEEDFSDWANERKQLRMEYFYRDMRKRTTLLMENGKPIGEKWNYDAENREKPPKDIQVPSPTLFEPDAITSEVLSLVEDQFASHFGDIKDFHYGVCRNDALIVLGDFIDNRLENFGRYQDAMVQDEPWMYHSHIAFYLNAGLLMPFEVLEAAEQAYKAGRAPINSVEGFIRQILGWREYVRGFYWHFMPKLSTQNYLQAKQALPDLYWGADTKMNCMAQCVKQTKEHAYAHHIQRLMVLGNFALLAGLDPEAVNEWYLIVYADAYEWVELPNVSSMVLFADGGQLASKPYAASGAYIHKMSNYCAHCEYSVKEKTGPQACPFNYLYWGFINKHKEKFEKNPRMAMIYRTMSKMDPSKLAHMIDDSDIFLLKLANKEPV